MKLYRKGRPPKPQRENTLSTSLRVDRDLWQRVKAEAAVFHQTLDEYVAGALEEKLNQGKKELDKDASLW